MMRLLVRSLLIPFINPCMSKTFCSKTQAYDIVIVGGGMTGAAMACSLGTSATLASKSTLVIDAGKRQALPLHHYSNRVCAISPGSIELFKKIAVWDDIKGHGAHAVLRMVVWEDASESRIEFTNYQNTHDTSEPVVFIIENQNMTTAFQERLDRLKNVSVAYGRRVERFKIPENPNEKVSIVLDNGVSIQANLLIGADGFESATRRAMKTHVMRFAYGQSSIVANLQILPQNGNNTAWQRFTRSGPLALLPLSPNVSSLSWAVDDASARRLMAMSDGNFTDALNAALNQHNHQSKITNQALRFFNSIYSSILPETPEECVDLVPTIIGVENRTSIPLHLLHATHYFSNRVVLIGDAAHRVHPLAGQGVNLGYGDVQALTNALEEAVSCGYDIACDEFLKNYESERQRQVVPMVLACDSLYRLYSTTLLPFVFARSLGLNTIDKIAPVKNALFSIAANSSERLS